MVSGKLRGEHKFSLTHKKSIEKTKFDGTQSRSDKDKKDFVFFY